MTKLGTTSKCVHLASSRFALSTCFLALAAVAGCGGGGSDAPALVTAASVPAPPPSPAQPPAPQTSVVLGPFGGTLAGTSPALDVLVLAARSQRSGLPEFWGIYGANAASDFKVAGFLTSMFSQPSITSTTVLDSVMDWNKDTAARWGSIKPLPLNLTLDSSGSSLTGSVAAPSGTLTVAAAKAPLAGYRFVSPARLESIQGRWDLTTSEGRSLSIDIAANGQISGTSGACTLYDSVISPASDGGGAFTFRMRLRAGNFGCEEPHASSDGVYGAGVAYVLPDGKGTQLVLAGWNGWDPVYLAAAGKR